jgi:hypothetical protein
MVLTPPERHVVDVGLHDIGMVSAARADLFNRLDGDPSMTVLLGLVRTLNSERTDQAGSARQAAGIKLLIRKHLVDVMGVEETRSINRQEAEREGPPVFADGSSGTIEFTLMPTPVTGMSTADIFREAPPELGSGGGAATPLVISKPASRPLPQ